MKKTILASLITSLFVISSCSSSVEPLTPDMNLQNPEVSALAASVITLSMDKSEPSSPRKATPSKLKNRAEGNTKKEVVIPKITFQKVVAKNASASITDKVSATLFAMNAAKSHEEGYKIAIKTLEELKAKDIYIAKLTLAAANAATEWTDIYRVSALGFSKILADMPETQENACSLTKELMSTCRTFESAAKAGYAMLEVISTTSNTKVKSYVLSLYAKAQATPSFESAYRLILPSLDELKTIN